MGQALPGVALRRPGRYALRNAHEGNGLDPTIEPETQGLAADPAPPSRVSGLRFWVRRIAVVVLVLAAMPIGLTLVYAVPGVRPVSTLMVADLLMLRGYDRQWVALEDVAPVLRHSVIMSEDGQFCRHYGVDLGELRGVVDDALAGETTRGASTIPMQTVKNLYLWNSRSMLRKAAELPLAVYFDLVLSKRRILEIYLNIAEWGPGIYGIEAAAQHHFRVPAKNLTARQAALLTVTLPNPITRNPAKPSAALNRLARIVQRRAAIAGDYVGCVD